MGPEQEARAMLDIGERLGLDPMHDIELLWIVQEFQNAPLPDDWRIFEGPDNRTHYINERLRYDVLTNPIEPRFRKLVEIIRDSKVKETPLDEVTVLELIDPIERAADVADMAEYQGIDPRKEPHLLWIAKLAVLETMPEGWEEYVDPTGRIMYRNTAKDLSTDQHPADDYFKALLERERAKPLPYTSIKLENYLKPVTHFRKDIAADGSVLRTLTEPASGTFYPFYDLYGQYYWYDLITQRITTDLQEVRQGPAATVIQRCWRGFLWRRRLWELHEAAMTIAKAWRSFEYRRAFGDVKSLRVRAVKRIQRFWRMRVAKCEASKVLFLRLAELGARSRRLARIRARTDSLQQTDHSFPEVRKRIIMVQRIWRGKLQNKLIEQMRQGPPYAHDEYIVTHATQTIQREFRDMQARKAEQSS